MVAMPGLEPLISALLNTALLILSKVLTISYVWTCIIFLRLMLRRV